MSDVIPSSCDAVGVHGTQDTLPVYKNNENPTGQNQATEHSTLLVVRMLTLSRALHSYWRSTRTRENKHPTVLPRQNSYRNTTPEQHYDKSTSSVQYSTIRYLLLAAGKQGTLFSDISLITILPSLENTNKHHTGNK